VNPESEHIPVTRANGITSVITLPGAISGGRGAGAPPVIAGQAALIHLDGWTWAEMAVERSAAMQLIFPTLQTRPARSGAAEGAGPAISYNDAKRAYDQRLRELTDFFENARRYQKAKAALREVPALLEETELRLRYLDEIATMADLAETADAVRALRAEIRPEATRSTQQLKRRRPPRVESGVLRLRAADGTEMLVGRSARQNHEVTFELARPEDVWLHARGCPGAHVVLRVNGGTPSRRTLEEAAAVAAYFSSNRTAGRVTVDWTRRKLVRRLGNGTPGLVSYSGEQSLVVRPEMRASEPARR